MNRARISFLPILVLVSLAGSTVGCSKKQNETATDAGAAPSANVAASAAPDAGNPLARRGLNLGGGPAGMLIHEAKMLELNDTQKAAVTKLEEQLQTIPQPRKEAREIHVEVANEVKAGKIEQAKLAPTYTAMDKAVTAQKEQEAAALNTLYATLEPAQRKALVDDVRGKLAEMDKHMPPPKDDAQRREMVTKQKVERYSRDAELDDTQKKSLEAIFTKDAAKDGGLATMPDMAAEMRATNEAVVDAFEKDPFDATKLPQFDGAAAAKKARVPIEQEVTLLTQLLPILKPDQREKLSVKLSRQAAMGGPQGLMGPGMMRPGMPNMRMPQRPGEGPQPTPPPGAPPAPQAH
ncbi:hypothetical protein AKJ09_07302 [Labilithrix luteola]|uniref:Uncharacterized protein n=1 Tax=Labilithrix luteola TaxID=1391654 RepID=A0A0K1Q4G7_9BACT|nr:Spy/CpxP family protein refolding chaperone [Labilithrix luteola]AKV00639.1 hypothetical protein AKJ09_07302 [Labilithrix luteola]